MTKTTNKYLCYPAAATGISRASSGGSWTNSAYTEVVPASTITSEFYVCGLTWVWWTPLAAADTTYEVEFDLATGGSGSEAVIITVPASIRGDTLVGHVPSNCVVFAEPKTVAANTRIAVRMRYGVAASVTVTAIKILYQGA